MLISCVLQCTDGLRLIKRLENYAYRMSEKTAYRSLEKSAYRSLKKLLTVHLQIHLTACKLTTLLPTIQLDKSVWHHPSHELYLHGEPSGQYYAECGSSTLGVALLGKSPDTHPLSL